MDNQPPSPGQTSDFTRLLNQQADLLKKMDAILARNLTQEFNVGKGQLNTGLTSNFCQCFQDYNVSSPTSPGAGKTYKAAINVRLFKISVMNLLNGSPGAQTAFSTLLHVRGSFAARPNIYEEFCFAPRQAQYDTLFDATGAQVSFVSNWALYHEEIPAKYDTYLVWFGSRSASSGGGTMFPTISAMFFGDDQPLR